MAQEEAHDVRNDQAHKADRTCHADDGCCDQRSDGEQDQANPGHGNAQRGGCIIAKSKSIQRSRIVKAYRKPYQYDDQRQLKLRPSHAAETAQQPKHHVTRLLRASGCADGVSSNRVEELRRSNAR